MTRATAYGDAVLTGAVWVAWLSSCGPTDSPDYCGVESSQFFPFDGNRTWEFINADPSVTYKLVVTQGSDPTPSDVGNVYALEHRVGCVSEDPDCLDGELVRTVHWSSTGTQGVFVHGVTVGGAEATIEPPVTLADECMLVDEEAWTTSASDGTWISDLVRKEACPVALTTDWDSCVVFDVDDAGSSSIHDHVAGTYWANFGYNLVAFDLVDDGVDRWELSSVVCPDDPCDGEW
jgi:hypothetical protein